MRRALTRPGIVVPILLSLALLALVLSLSDVPRVFDRIGGIPLSALAATLALAFIYLALKAIELRFLLEQLDIHTRWRQLILAYSVGEMTLPIPAGIYAENWMLQRTGGIGFARSSAATTGILAVEAVLSLVVLLILGIPGWDWLRPLILALCVAAGGALLVLTRVSWVQSFIDGPTHPGLVGVIRGGLHDLMAGLRSLAKPSIILPIIPIAAAYLFTILAAFYIVAHGVGVGRLTFTQAMSIYLFALAVVLLSPTSTHIGIVEASGFSAAEAWGYDATQALAMLLGFRVVWTGATWLICGTAVLLLRSEMGRSSLE